MIPCLFDQQSHSPSQQPPPQTQTNRLQQQQQPIVLTFFMQLILFAVKLTHAGMLIGNYMGKLNYQRRELNSSNALRMKYYRI